VARNVRIPMHWTGREGQANRIPPATGARRTHKMHLR
jgi:hypothetical protein